MENKMFCYQCQETAGCKGCTQIGVCGKLPDVANMQDLLVYVTKGLSEVATALRAEGKSVPREIGALVTYNLFVTITNANFDKEAIIRDVETTLEEKAKFLAQLSNKEGLTDAANWDGNMDEYEAKAKTVGVLAEQNEDIRSLKELITYGLKGLAAYEHHANMVGRYNDATNEFVQSALADTLKEKSVDELIALTLETGKYGVDAMADLDAGNTGKYGNPELTKVNIGVGNKPGILISGHDLNDLEQLLDQTKGTGVDVYTHSEMLPAHYYPKFKEYDNLVGNYGNAWWQQKEEFESFNGPILFTTNCIVPPKDSYKDRVYTTGAAGFPGCGHIKADENGKKDFTAIIEHAKKCAPPTEIEKGEIVGGFAHNQVLALADTVVDAVKSGAIKKFFVMAGCDGRTKDRNYYTRLFQKIQLSLRQVVQNTDITSWISAISAEFQEYLMQVSVMIHIHLHLLRLSLRKYLSLTM